MATRNYKKEYENFHSSAKAKKARAARNKSRREAEKDGRVSKGDGKDIDHKTPLRNGGSSKKSNTRVQSRKTNRSANGHRKGETQRKKGK